MISYVIIDFLFGQILSQSLSSPVAERTGAAIFRKELNFARKLRIAEEEMIQSGPVTLTRWSYCSTSYQDYPLPVR